MCIAWEGKVQYGGSSFVVVSGSVDDNIKGLNENIKLMLQLVRLLKTDVMQWMKLTFYKWLDSVEMWSSLKAVARRVAWSHEKWNCTLITSSSGWNVVIPYTHYICEQCEEERNLKGIQIYGKMKWNMKT